MLHIVFMGTSSFGTPCLEYLSEREDIDIGAVVTKPPRPSGRSRLLKHTPIKEMAVGKGLKVLEPVDVKSENFAKDLKDLNPDLNIVVAFGKILPEEILKIPRCGSINIHPSLLPLYRGPSPIQWAIINGERETGVTSFFMEEGMDTGPIITQHVTAIGSDDDREMLETRLKDLACEVLAETLDKIKEGSVTPKPQDNKKATIAPKITSHIAKIDWSKDADMVYNLIRGLSPIPGAYTFFKKDRFINEPEDEAILIKIWKAGLLRDRSSKGEPGRIMEVDSCGMKVFSGRGIVNIFELQPAGKNRMKAQAFWSGYG